MQQRTLRTVIALGCAVALLLPLLSIFDDDFFDRDAFDELAVLAAAIVISLALTALANVEPQERSLARVQVAVLTDPRSPPRA